jgi:hypothetical protein
MQVERHVELRDRAPERPVLRQVVIERAVGRPACEKPFTSAPTKPSSLTQRVSSRAAASGSCIGSAAKPTKRSGRLAISAASTSFASRATSIARATSKIACTAGALSDRIISSTPEASISRRRLSKSVRRGPSSFHTCAPNTCESASVAAMAKCSSSAIFPCMAQASTMVRTSGQFPQTGPGALAGC